MSNFKRINRTKRENRVAIALFFVCVDRGNLRGGGIIIAQRVDFFVDICYNAVK